MGAGYWLTEKLNYDGQTGELVTNRTWTYKVPGAKDIPIDFRIKFLQGINNDGIFGSKATGEPALCMSVVVVFALRQAIDAVHFDNGNPNEWYRLGIQLIQNMTLISKRFTCFSMHFRFGKYARRSF